MPPILLALALAASPTVAPAPSAPPAAAAGAPAGGDPVRYARAFALSDAVQSQDQAIAAAMAMIDRDFVPGMLKNPAVAKLEAAHPGILGAIWDAARPVLRRYLVAKMPEMRRRQATIYATALTAQELEEVGAFLRGPVGRKFVLLAQDRFDLSNLLQQGVSGETATAGSVRQTVEAASIKGFNGLTQAERKAIVEFAYSPAGRALARVTPKIAEETAQWMNAPDPEAEREVTSAISAAAEKFMRTHPQALPR